MGGSLNTAYPAVTTEPKLRLSGGTVPHTNWGDNLIGSINATGGVTVPANDTSVVALSY